MSGHNAARTLPASDRDDAPTLDLGEALRDTPLHADAPPLDDDPEHHLLKLTRIVPEVLKDFCTCLYAMRGGNRQAAIGALKRFDTNLTEARALAGRLSRFIERASTKES